MAVAATGLGQAGQAPGAAPDLYQHLDEGEAEIRLLEILPSRGRGLHALIISRMLVVSLKGIHPRPSRRYPTYGALRR
jgi:hypothetical protein